MTPADRFHAHLDGCVRCRTTPFSLCAEGSVLLHLAARALEATAYLIETHAPHTMDPLDPPPVTR